MNWLPDIFRRRKIYGDLAEEMRLHLEERTEQLMKEGMSRKEAEQTARRAFGNSTLLEERSREVWQMPWVESLGSDLKLVFRRLRKSPGFAATVILTLAIGIGANTAVFSVVNSVLLKPLPYPDAEQLVAVPLIAPGAAGLADFSSGLRLSPSMYFTFAEQNRTFQSLGVWIAGIANVTGVAQPERSTLPRQRRRAADAAGSARAWPLAAARRTRIRMARRPSCSATATGSAVSAEIASAIGRSIDVDSQPRHIVGVMPRGFRMVECGFRSDRAARASTATIRFWRLRIPGHRPGLSPESPSRRLMRTWPACCQSGWTRGRTARAPILTRLSSIGGSPPPFVR